MLANDDSTQLAVDLASIRKMEKEGLFEFDEEGNNMSSSSDSEVVIVVDPISTGGTVAFEAFMRGYKVMAVWCSELTTEFRSHVPNCCKTNGFAFFAEIEEE